MVTPLRRLTGWSDLIKFRLKADVREPMIYALIIGTLLAFRLVVALQRRPATRARRAAATSDLAQRPL